MQALLNALEFLASVSILATLFLFTPLWGPRITYANIPRTTNDDTSQRIAQFGIADLGCAFVYIAAANALLILVRDEYRHWPLWASAMPLLANAFAVLTWWLAIRFANSFNVLQSQQRILVQLIFFPCSTIVVGWVAVALLLLLSGLDHLANGFVDGIVRYWTDPAILGLMLLLAGSILAVYGLRLGFRFLVVGSHNVMAEPTDSPASSS